MRFIIDKEGKLVKVEHLNKNITKIILPDNIKSIGQSAFSTNKNFIKEIIIPDTVEIIERYAFSNCKYLEKIEIPNSVRLLGESAFSSCSNLRVAILSKSIDRIENNAFNKCSKLVVIKMPSSIKYIGSCAFRDCHSLKRVTLPIYLEEISDYAFDRCFDLEEVIFNEESIKKIGNNAFSHTNIRKLEISKSIETIEKNTYMGSKKIKNLIIPENVKKIESGAFEDCAKLESLSLHSSIENIASNAFKGVYRLKSLKFREYSFQKMSSINDFRSLVYAEDYFVSNEPLNINALNIINKEEGRIDQVSASLIISSIYGIKDIKKMKEFSHILYFIVDKIIDKENYEIIANELKNNSKEFSRLLKKLCAENPIDRYEYDRNTYFDLFKLAYSLGAFSNNQIERQRACEFLSNAYDKNMINYDYIHGSFESLEFKGFNKEWAEFLMNKNNFQELVNLELEESGFISKIYNNFEKIKEFGKSNKGNQRYRKVTIEICEKFFSKIDFGNIDCINEDIADEISKFTNKKEIFDEAVKIREEYLNLKEQGKVKDHILEMEISDIRKEIINDSREIITTLNEVANNKFSYEFLSKYDAKNYVLGKYCACCSHLEGVGAGIVNASILHPDCQNLIIKDETGKIIAKSTLYINRSKGYAVFNNIEMSNSAENMKNKKYVYEKYKEAIERFAKEYNKRNPSRPIKQINVGMSFNSLENQLRKNNQKSDEILTAIDFSEYGGSYKGDWQEEQYVIWSKENKRKR